MKDCRHSGGLRINRSSRQSASPPTQEMELGTRCYQPNVMNVSCVKLKFLIDFESTLINKYFPSIFKSRSQYYYKINNVS